MAWSLLSRIILKTVAKSSSSLLRTEPTNQRTKQRTDCDRLMENLLVGRVLQHQKRLDDRGLLGVKHCSQDSIGSEMILKHFLYLSTMNILLWKLKNILQRYCFGIFFLNVHVKQFTFIFLFTFNSQWSRKQSILARMGLGSPTLGLHSGFTSTS